MQNIIELIKSANPARALSNTKRRLLKITEEKGEVAEAVLNVTSPYNGKNKTWDDVREELVDCFIVAADIALTLDIDMNFDFHIRHIDKYDESAFIDKMMVTGHLLSSLGNTIDIMIKPPIADYDYSDGKCISKSMTRLFYELATLVFPDKDDLSEQDILDAFTLEVTRKISKWTAKRERNVVDDGTV